MKNLSERFDEKFEGVDEFGLHKTKYKSELLLFILQEQIRLLEEMKNQGDETPMRGESDDYLNGQADVQAHITNWACTKQKELQDELEKNLDWSKAERAWFPNLKPTKDL
jgi:hypothetical protein